MTGPDLRQLVDGAAVILAEAGVPSPLHDAKELARFVLGEPHLNLVVPPALPADFMTRFAQVVERRRQREPLQLIVGLTWFRYLELQVRPGVFIPRPETEIVAGAAVAEVERLGTGPVLVVDLCCGTGPIGLSVAQETKADVVMVDLDETAVDLTRANADHNQVQVQVLVGDVRDSDLLGDLLGRVDVVVSNPPYIPADAVPVDLEVANYDPDLALYGGGDDGLLLPQAVLAAAARLLRPGGLLVMEHAERQDEALRNLASEYFDQVLTLPDLTGRPRMVQGRQR